MQTFKTFPYLSSSMVEVLPPQDQIEHLDTSRTCDIRVQCDDLTNALRCRDILNDHPIFNSLRGPDLAPQHARVHPVRVYIKPATDEQLMQTPKTKQTPKATTAPANAQSANRQCNWAPSVFDSGVRLSGDSRTQHSGSLLRQQRPGTNASLPVLIESGSNDSDSDSVSVSKDTAMRTLHKHHKSTNGAQQRILSSARAAVRVQSQHAQQCPEGCRVVSQHISDGHQHQRLGSEAFLPIQIDSNSSDLSDSDSDCQWKDPAAAVGMKHPRR